MLKMFCSEECWKLTVLQVHKKDNACIILGNLYSWYTYWIAPHKTILALRFLYHNVFEYFGKTYQQKVLDKKLQIYSKARITSKDKCHYEYKRIRKNCWKYESSILYVNTAMMSLDCFEKYGCKVADVGMVTFIHIIQLVSNTMNHIISF